MNGDRIIVPLRRKNHSACARDLGRPDLSSKAMAQSNSTGDFAYFCFNSRHAGSAQ